ncbi:hypothetical protein ACFY7H_26890 [Streptomyces sp. NPDC012794]|uniref:hypothetical protein n=1 Tax=Streptomyces sp. NPDC012794 TaxID=3364850 RepID=UPI0036835DD2
METPTARVIGQLTDYLRGLTRRLDPGAGWYGEFLRRDPEGMRACLDGVAMPPWDVLESLLGDLPREAGDAAGEAVYAAALRAAAVAAWDAMPGGEGELRTLLDAAVAQRAALEEALRGLTARRAGAGSPAEAAALDRELAWARDDAARAAARAADLAARLAALRAEPGAGARGPQSSQPGARPPELPQRRPGSQLSQPGTPSPSPQPSPPPWPQSGPQPSPVQLQPQPQQPSPEPPPSPEPLPAVSPQREGRWLRGARRAGGARYAGAPSAAVPAPGEPAPAAAVPDLPVPAPRGARYIRPAAGRTPPARGDASPAPGTAPAAAGATRAGHPGPHPDAHPAPAPAGPDAPSVRDTPAGAPAPGPRGGFTAELLMLRAQGRGGEAHALLCEAAAWPAAELPALAAELGRAGLAADWATLLWEAASLPPDRLAAAAAALGEAGREADCDGLLRQGAARPAAEVAEAALALGTAGRDREAQALLGAFVRLRTAEEAAGLARRDPHWFAPRLLRAARALSGTRHRDLAHALRVAGITVP